MTLIYPEQVTVSRQFFRDLQALCEEYRVADICSAAPDETPPWQEEEPDTSGEPPQDIALFHEEFSRRLAAEIPKATLPASSQSGLILPHLMKLRVDDLLNYAHYLSASRTPDYHQHVIGIIKTLAQDGGVKKIKDLGSQHTKRIPETVRQRENEKLAEAPPPPPPPDLKGRIDAKMRQVLRGDV